MIKALYTKNQVFFNLLLCNLIGTALNTFQWMGIEQERSIDIVKYKFIDFFNIIIISQLMIITYNWAGKRNPLFLKVTVFILFSFVSPTLLLFISNLVKFIIWPDGIWYPLSFESAKLATNLHLMFFLILGAVYYLTHLRQDYIEQKETMHKAESLAKDAQLKMLRYQINPHFLFNILNSIHALIDENKEKAKKLIVDISEYYRFTLDKHIEKHTIENEISIIKKYLEIQKIRFETNFEYEIEVDDKAKSIQIPSFIIHLLIENAVKYGLKFEKKLIIKLHISLIYNYLSINVINSGKIAEPTDKMNGYLNGTGSGISNITNRLKLFFEDNFTFSLREENNWVIAKIDINYDRL